MSRNNLSHCKYCRGITLAGLQDGYRHAPSRASLVRSAQRCRLCSLLFRKDRSRHSSQLMLRLEPFSKNDPQICLRILHVGGDAVVQQQLSLFLFTSTGDPALGYGINLKRRLSTTASTESFQSAAAWIADCVGQHDCSTRLMLEEHDTGLQLWPSRLVDVQAFDSPCEDVRLVDNDGSRDKYITLSYCWGHSRTFKTTTRSVRLRKACITFDSLPKTFQDAVLIARRLGIRYLWIDALCIVQDDRRDWERESAKMGAIYSLAFITIAADASSDCNGGCFNTQSTSQDEAFETGKPLELICRTASGTKSSVFIWDPNRGTRRSNLPEIDGSPLAERGWVCQERILSPRILHYTRTQLFYECRQHLLAEDNLRPWTLWSGRSGASGTVCGLARHLYGTTHDDGDGRALLLDIWYANVVAQSYSRRKLSLADDKLTAISGIARAFHRHLRSGYVAGLWTGVHHRHDAAPAAEGVADGVEDRDLAWGLSWRVRGAASRPTHYRAPSFSWAALDAVVEWSPRPTQSTDLPPFRVRALRTSLAGSDAFGRVSAATLTLSAHIAPAVVAARKRMSGGGGAVDVVWELRAGGPESSWLGTAYLDDEGALQEGAAERVECLLLGRDGESGAETVLLLEKVGGACAKDEFVRRGVAEILGLDKGEGGLVWGVSREVILY